MEATKGRTEKNLWEALYDVKDPEFPISVVDMGLIYNIETKEKNVTVTMTFTTTGCGCTNWIKSDIVNRLLEEPNVSSVDIEVVWNPPWTKDMMSLYAKEQLKGWGVVI